MVHTIYIPPGTPEPLRAAIGAAQQALDQQHALFGAGAGAARPALPPLPQLSGGGHESALVTAAHTQLRQRQDGIHHIDAQIRAVSATQSGAISDWGTQQITAIVTDLNQKFDAIGHAGGPPGPGAPPPAPPAGALRMARDLDDALSAAWQVVHDALDKANHTSGTVTDHSDQMRQHAAPAHVEPAQPAPILVQPVQPDIVQAQPVQPEAAAPPSSPYTDGYCVGNQYVSGFSDEDHSCYDGSMA